jgi:Fe2+ or Zn2+ uptake regulation protein
MNSADEQIRRETLRWLILRTLHSSQEIGASEALVRNVVEAQIPDVTSSEIRRALDYLEKRKLIDITDRDRPVWIAVINRYGCDVVEYEVPCEPGIARPKQW